MCTRCTTSKRTKDFYSYKSDICTLCRDFLLSKGLKTCGTCKQELPLVDFTKRTSTKEISFTNSQSQCTHCDRMYIQEYRQKNIKELRIKEVAYRSLTKEQRDLLSQEKKIALPKQIQKNRRNRRLRSIFGITTEDYELKLRTQNYVCAACGQPNERDDVLLVDHLHIEGYQYLPPEEKRKFVRGLLCHPCNVIIGLCKEDPTILSHLVEYLLLHQSITKSENKE